ncbi:MAG: bifunctional phosphoglucose/phosphomannose isomerase [Candidatus Paceibacterota bacterium]
MNNLNKTSILDSREEIAKLDKSNMLGSIEALADQVRHAWETIQLIKFPSSGNIYNVVVAGMGGSALGADVFKHLYADQLPEPFEIYNGYNLPAYVDNETLVILSSYSGGTEETLSCAAQAKEMGAQVAVITAGGKLAEIAEQENYPTFLIDPVHNPSNQPRMAIGYAITGLIGLLVKAGLLELTDTEIEEVITTIIRTAEKLGPETAQDDNQAKILAFTSLERRPILVASEFLVGAAHAATNQFNENAKIFADFKVVPELNHHLMEGLRFPGSNALSHVFLFFNSSLYLARNQKRMKLTQEIVEQNHIDTLAVDLQASTKLTQVFELITLMAYANFYVAILEGIDPSPIPFVDQFKEELGK